jgi:NRPS condensation-like uncharacterized protein
MGLLENPPPKEEVGPHMNRVIEGFPRMRQVVCGAKDPHWKDDENFSLENHILWRKGSINLVANEEFSAGVSITLPLWRIVFIEDENETAMLFLCHHSFSDGVGFMELFESLCSETPNGPLKLDELKARRARYDSRTPTHEGMGSSFRSFWGSVKKLISDGRQPKILSPLNGTNSAKRRLLFFDLDLQQVNKNRKELAASLYEYMLALTTSGVQEFYRSINHPLDDVRIIMPINLRSRAETLTLGNRISGASVMLPVHAPGIREQIVEIKKRINTIRENFAIGSYELLAKLNALLPPRLQKTIAEFAAKKTSFICTSVPASTKDQYFLGIRMHSKYGAPALMAHHGLAFAYIRGQGRMHVGLVYDPNIIEDPHALVAGFKQAHLDFCSTFFPSPKEHQSI